MYCLQFAVFLLVILIVEIAIGIVVFVKMNGEGWEQAVNDSITENFGRYNYNDSDNTISNAVNNFQHDVSVVC